MTDQRIALVVEFHPAPGKASELRDAILGVVEATRAEDGCLLYDLHEDLDDTDSLVFYEIWETPSHHAAHDLTPHIVALRNELPDLTSEPPRVRRLRLIQPDA